ncbi:vacuolar protease A precursor [Mucor ambiguus]|uniref:rhizopuspepsin n=1 Tax=Mucor ambiguus TaxID=91626 RepID=A0A0C9M7N7_9FUNG|nr:vacuolar protease A precursor [Mucor ambiguus]
MKFSLVSSCVALVVMTLAVDAAPSGGKKLSIPLSKNDNYQPDIKRALAKVRAKYGKHIINPLHGVPGNATTDGGNTADGTGSVPVTDYQNDIEYYGIVKVGTPAQSLKIDFDTGSSDFWFASTLCSSCTAHTRYDSKKSSTYAADGRPWSIRYADGSTASGVLAKDTVNVGGLVIKGQTINLAKTLSSSFASGPVDGLMGLGFDTITTVAGIKTPVDNLISQGVISSPVFGVWLGKAGNGGGGEYLFGGSNPNHYTGPLTTVPVDSSQGWYSITVDGLSIADSPVSNSFTGILDTGTTLLLLPQTIADQVASQYGASDNGDGTYLISCDTTYLQPLVFSINGAQFEVPADSLIFQQSGSYCFAGFGYSPGIDFAIIGDVFLKNNYVVFNQKVPQVQIAKAR